MLYLVDKYVWVDICLLNSIHLLKAQAGRHQFTQFIKQGGLFKQPYPLNITFNKIRSDSK